MGILSAGSILPKHWALLECHHSWGRPGNVRIVKAMSNDETRSEFMWETQCHQPTMTGYASNPTWWFRGWFMPLGLPHQCRSSTSKQFNAEHDAHHSILISLLKRIISHHQPTTKTYSRVRENRLRSSTHLPRSMIRFNLPSGHWTVRELENDHS